MNKKIFTSMLTQPGREKWRNLALKDASNLGLNVKIELDDGRTLSEKRVDALKKCDKPYFIWLDDDDRYPDNGALQFLIKKMDKSESPFGFSAERKIDSDGNFFNVTSSEFIYDFNVHVDNPSHVHGLIIIKREFIDDEILNKMLYKKFPEHCLTLELAINYGAPCFTNLIGRHWRQHNNNYYKTNITYK